MRDLNAIVLAGWQLVAHVARMQSLALRKGARERAIRTLLDLCETLVYDGLEASFFERDGKPCTGDSGKVGFVALSSRNVLDIYSVAEAAETGGRLDILLSPLGRAVLWFPLRDAQLPKGEVLVKKPLPHPRVAWSPVLVPARKRKR